MDNWKNRDFEELMNEETALHRFLETDPQDVGCEEAMELLHVYVELIAEDAKATAAATATLTMRKSRSFFTCFLDQSCACILEVVTSKPSSPMITPPLHPIDRPPVARLVPRCNQGTQIATKSPSAFR